MKTKLLSFVICLILIFSAFPFSGLAENDAVGRAQSLSDGIVAFKCDSANVKTVQEMIDSDLTQRIGADAEWYVIALSQNGNYDFSVYKSALDTYISSNNVRSAVTRQKLALIYPAISAESEYVEQTVAESIGELGVMSYVYGLHLLSNGFSHPSETVESVVDTLMNMRLEDGGWAVTGKVSDVDVTAMTLQALAPYADGNDAVTDAINNALDMLSSRQNDDGSFNSYGVANPESVAQVIIALSALGIDCASDARFIKNGNDLFDAVERFRLEDGSFSHTADGASNANATAQVFLGLNAYIHFKNGNRSIYLLKSVDEDADVIMSDNVSDDENVQAIDNVSNTESEGTSYKVYATIALLLLGVVLMLVLLFLKKLNIKNSIAVLVGILLLVCIVWITDVQSAEEYYDGSDVSKNAVGSVTISISCSLVAEDTSNQYIPDDGIILSETEFGLAEGESVFDILTQAAKKYGIHLETNGAADSVYVSGISYLYEFDHGDMSGWAYRVNGVRPSEGCGSYILQDGDRIEWIYTLELGNDLE